MSLKENIQDAVKQNKKRNFNKDFIGGDNFFLPIVDYGDVLYLNASVHCLHMLD